MKKLLSIFLITVIFISCGKDNEFSNNFSAVAVINASPSPAFISVGVFVDTILQSTLPFRGATPGYLSVAPGARRIQLKNSNTLIPYGELPTENFVANTASTIFVYDTLTSSTSTLRTVRLNDDLTLPAPGFIKVRFVNLAPRSGPVDVTFLRTSTVPNDSVTFSNVPYIGTNPDINRFSTFTSIPIGSYTVRVKNAGTQTLALASTALSLTALTGQGNITGISTIYLTGGAVGQTQGVGIFRHYP